MLSHEIHDGKSTLATDRNDAMMVGARCVGSPAAMDLARRGHLIAGEAGAEVREGFAVIDDGTLIWPPKAGHHPGRTGPVG